MDSHLGQQSDRQEVKTHVDLRCPRRTLRFANSNAKPLLHDRIKMPEHWSKQNLATYFYARHPSQVIHCLTHLFVSCSSCIGTTLVLSGDFIDIVLSM